MGWYTEPWQSSVPQRRAMYSETLAPAGTAPPSGDSWVKVAWLGQRHTPGPPSSATQAEPPAPTHEERLAARMPAAARRAERNAPARRPGVWGCPPSLLTVTGHLRRW